MEDRLVVRLAGVAGVAREHLAGVALAREQLDGITTFVLGMCTGQRQVEEEGRTRRRRERRPEARLANTRVNRTGGKTSSTWKADCLCGILGEMDTWHMVKHLRAAEASVEKSSRMPEGSF